MFGRDDARHDKLKHQQKWNGVERGHGLSAIYISAISILRIESLHWDSCWDSFDSMKLKIKNIFELSGGSNLSWHPPEKVEIENEKLVDENKNELQQQQRKTFDTE